MKLGALPLPLGKCSKRDAFAIGECRVEPARPELLCENRRTAGRIGEDGLAPSFRGFAVGVGAELW